MRPLRGKFATQRSYSHPGTILLQPGTSATDPALDASARLDSPGYFASHWRSLDYFNLYRLILAATLSVLALLGALGNVIGQGSPALFRTASFMYLGGAAMFVLTIRARSPNFRLQLSAHIFADIVFITLLMAASGGVSSGLGLLLLISLASGGLVGEGRLVLFYAALASVATLLMQADQGLQESSWASHFLQAGLLCLGYFSVAWLAHALTSRALRSERQAHTQAKELARLSRIHALVAGDLPDGIVAVDRDSVIFYSNDAASQLIGADRPPAAREPLKQYAPLLAGQLLTNRVSHASQGYPLTIMGRRFLPRYQPLPRNEGTIIILEDLNRREQIARQLKLAALGQLTANIAHEIRNPLSAIQQASQLLREESENPVTGKLTALIENNVRRLDRLVSDVLVLNRRDRLQPENIRLMEFLPSWLQEWRIAEDLPENAVIISMHADLPPICFDPQHLRQILWNLVRNAWRHGSKRLGSVKLAVRPQGTQVQLDIQDDGPGIAPGDRERLFEPFFTTEAQGTGLGLYIARELAEANQARLEETGSRTGACFTLTVETGPC
ncbi:MAG: sensor histidine kinase [Thiobacillaceae bacterium]